MEKEITIKIDESLFTQLEVEMMRRRQAGQANGFSNTFLIRLIENINKGNKVVQFKTRPDKTLGLVRGSAVKNEFDKRPSSPQNQ